MAYTICTFSLKEAQLDDSQELILLPPTNPIKELGQNERADELKTAIITLIRQTDHQGLIYKFQIDI